MKACLITLFLTIFFWCHGQVDSSDHFNPLTGFIPKNTVDHLDFYKSPNGKKIDSIKILKSGWVHFSINHQKGNWVKIKNVSIAPGIKDLAHLNNNWVKTSDVWFNLSNNGAFYYVLPNDKSKKHFIDYQSVNLIEINGNWVKAKFMTNAHAEQAWFKREDLCGSPWTTCNY